MGDRVISAGMRTSAGVSPSVVVTTVGRRSPPFDPAARFVRELGLSPAQQARLDSLLARQRDEVQQNRQETQPRYDSIAAQTSREVDSLLSPEQRRMLDSIKAGRPRVGRTGAHPPSSH